METKRRESVLGIIGWDMFEYIVEDLEDTRRFYRDKMDLPEIARLNESSRGERGEDAAMFQVGNAPLICTSPLDKGSRAGRWLKRHPEGISLLALRVRDLDATYRELEKRGATIWTPITKTLDRSGATCRYLEIATPLGDVRLRFSERPNDSLLPGFEYKDGPDAGNRFGLQVVDHVTSNMLTIEPYITWLRDVLGFEEYWRIQFHTQDAGSEYGNAEGTGLFSIVMWDPGSGIKLANNEPLAPNFEKSQISTFVEDNGGPGVQHIAFHVKDIISTVDGLRREGMNFLDTPGTYYDMLPERLRNRKVSSIQEDLDTLRKLGILVDGNDDRYLLQIFSLEGKMLHHSEQGGPFFYEVIQRRGARGFGEGNFRALFEAIERDQKARGRV
ncbi:MAG: VOC family protein [Acidobacteriota bacterium]